MHSSVEKLTMANIKNRAEISQLRIELNRIEREKVNELRMHNNAKQRFKAKYSSSHDSTIISEASDVKMYETHNPGFCYKRNGEHKLQQVQSVNPTVDFEHLHFLLFTDGEVDIEKVLCLHLLSAHETEHLAPPIKPKTLSHFVYKKYSPLEQLIERSKGRHSEIQTMMFLPTYILDVRGKDNSEERILIRDGRLSSRLLVNEKIFELIGTVLTTLEKSNPEKLKQLEEIASDPSNLRRIFRKSHILEFIKQLKNHTLIHNCGSFALTAPFKMRPSHLEVTTGSGYLENLVKFIRKSVLQFPTRATWKRALDEYEMTEKSPENSPRDAKRRPSNTNFVTKNIVAISNYYADKALKKSSKKKSAADDSIEMSRRNVSKNDNKARIAPLTKTKRKVPDEIKVHLKQTTCSACMEKWKTPLPSPKISKLSKKKEDEEFEIDPSLKTNSIQRISTMIEREMYKLNSYDRKYSTHNNNLVLNFNKKGNKPMVVRDSLDLIRLDIHDLEKIKQEIREKETHKKLEKFLSNC